MYIQLQDSNSTIEDVEGRKFLSKPPPFHLRVAYFISVWSFKSFIRLALKASRRFQRRRGHLLRPEIRSYPVRPDLKNRIFRPEGSGNERLPLYLDVHGGGWAVTDPETDDEFCSYMARNLNIIVVSVDYHKSPSYKFPYALNDVAAVVDAVLRDESLNINKQQVAIGGFSAGGNLAFAASQLDILRGRLNGIVGFYCPLDMSESLEEKLQRRPKNSGTDLLKSSANFLTWAYVPYGVDRRDPLLSPRFAKREKLPEHVYLVGAEYDMLCHDAEQMAESLAAAESACERTGIPALSAEDGWRQGNVRWECARKRHHAFTHITQHGRKEIDRVKVCQEMYNRVGHWLEEDVWKEQSSP